MLERGEPELPDDEEASDFCFEVLSPESLSELWLELLPPGLPDEELEPEVEELERPRFISEDDMPVGESAPPVLPLSWSDEWAPLTTWPSCTLVVFAI